MKAKIAALALLTGSAFFSTDILADTKDYWVHCSNGKFEGRLTYTKTLERNQSMIKIKDYRITRRNGQKGGNKANVNIRFSSTYNNGMTTGWSYKSPDNRKQDGYWHSMADVIHNIGGPNQGFRDVGMTVEFIFDKSGRDPKCTVNSNNAIQG